MGDLHFFNPGNDLALASGQRYYTPPAAAVAMEHAGIWLPLLLGRKGDFVLTDGMRDMPEDLRKWDHGMQPWQGEEIEALRPWGWSPWAMEQFARAFRKKGARWHGHFDSDVDLQRVASLSHRRTSIALHHALSTDLTPVEAFTTDEVKATLRRWGRVVGKSPLSGSGRGVFHGSMHSADAFMRRCATSIARQGSVMIERELDRIAEFAMLFEMRRDNSISFLGYSLFETAGDTYTANLLLPDDEIRRRLSDLCPGENFGELERRMEAAMRHIVGAIPYDGFFGVDMMIYDNDGTPAVDTCIEVNMRTTMGVVAWMATRRLLHPDSYGRFMLKPQQEKRRGAIWSDGRLAEGCISLSPHNATPSFCIEAKRKAAHGQTGTA